ncbi:MAG TPA: TonB-dependent receptor [Dongiaceae bacterium]|nr:TonB-dependent receptor [Dongiaceae bacterium]
MAITLFPVSGKDALKRIRNVRTMLLLCSVLFIMSAGGASGAEVANSGQPLTDLPLEQLLEVSVFSASRKNQTLSDVSSAVFVINQEDIRRSGATTIPDLLRMVPGVQVASIDNNSWAISVRGFNGTYANKLLVMIDGRTVYTPLYGGVFWDVQDTLLEDIERIEVIRGPGSTMWGANAVNGVINIITKNAQDTKGALLTGLVGSRDRGTAAVRYGSSIGDSTNYRLYVKHTDRGDTTATTGPANDSMQLTRGGFRIDSAPAHNLNLTLQGDFYGGTANKTFTIPILSPPFSRTTPQPADIFGANILSRLDWLQSESSKFSLQLYYDRTSRETSIIKEERDTVDVDLQHNLRIAGSHEFTWGAGYRFLHDDIPGTPNALFLTPQSRSDSLVNLFVQAEITLLPEKLRFITGTKLEHNDFVGWELEPTARLLWTPDRHYSVWTAVTRSIRTPSRAEQDGKKGFAAFPPTPPAPLPLILIGAGSRELNPETLLAYELGFRADLSETFSLDISSFYNRYHGIVGPNRGNPFPEGGTQITVPINITNLNDYDSAGGEISLQWQPRDWWKLKGGYAYIGFFGDGVDDSAAVKATPSHQATLRSMLALGRDVDLDLWARYVGANRYPLFTNTTQIVQIPDYVALDVRLAWRPVAGVELSVVGQNLLESRHLETISDQSVVRHEIARSVYGKVTWAF